MPAANPLKLSARSGEAYGLGHFAQVEHIRGHGPQFGRNP
jgi:hypothetical protein